VNVAIIPARGGSKRLPGKNIKNFLGKPIIAYSIEAAKSSGLFDQVLVTTDSEKIAEVAREYGAITPFLRPPELSDDQTATAPVIDHALRWLQNQGNRINYACCIYATAPFIQPEYLRQGYEILTKKKCTTAYSVTSFPFPIFRASKINDGGCLEMFWPEYELARSQDLPEAYHDAGQFYWVNVDRFLQQQKLYALDSQPVVLPRHLVQDIDTLEDWIRAEFMYQALGLQQNLTDGETE
jgi:pseudaminic acid cytidylyltransferase